jgi:plasmid stabilization system protein ParE
MKLTPVLFAQSLGRKHDVGSSPPLAVTLTLEIHPAAQAEAEAAARYYAERNPGAAVAFTRELDVAIGEIEQSPHSFLRHVHGTHRILLRSYPFALVYRFDQERILILAVAHGSRRPGYWAARLRGAGGPG